MSKIKTSFLMMIAALGNSFNDTFKGNPTVNVAKLNMKGNIKDPLYFEIQAKRKHEIEASR